MNKLLKVCVALALAGGLFAFEILDLGLNNLKRASGLVPFTQDTVISAETTWSAVYAIDGVRGMSSYVNWSFRCDSCSANDSVVGKVILQEGYDGTTWLATTVLTTFTRLAGTAGKIDSMVEVNLYPMPFNRFGIANTASADDTFFVKQNRIYNHPQ